MGRLIPTRLPAAPLVALVERMLTQSTGDLDPATESYLMDGARARVMERIGINNRRLFDWRKPGARVDPIVADRVLTASPYLWFDVWPECPRGPKHAAQIAYSGKCETCDAHARARYAFTGVGPRRRAYRRRAVAA